MTGCNVRREKPADVAAYQEELAQRLAANPFRGIPKRVEIGVRQPPRKTTYHEPPPKAPRPVRPGFPF